MKELTENMSAGLEAVAFVGDTLAPFFLEEPGVGASAPLYGAFAQIDTAAAAAEWPFGDSANVLAGLQKMRAGLVDGVTDDLVWEYRRLFMGPDAKAAPPWGSVYTDHDGVIFGESTLALRAWMRANGVEKRFAEGDPEDHIGLLLAMMAWIARHRPELLVDFLRLHVLTWSSHYLDLLAQRTGFEFFAGLAMLAKASLEGIGQHFGIPVDYPRFYR